MDESAVDWAGFDRESRGYHRAWNGTFPYKLTLGDDSGPLQIWQAEGLPSELRDNLQRHGEFGVSSMPLPGAGAHIAWQGGHRRFGRLVSVEDPRYRPKGLKGGESLGYMVDGADAKGENGTLRKLWQGALGWVHSIFGKTINLGDNDTQTILIGGTGVTSLTIKVQGSTQVTIQGGSGSPLAVKRSDGSNATNLFTT